MTTPDIVVVDSLAPGLFVHVNRILVAGETVMDRGYHEPVDGGTGSTFATAHLGAVVRFVGYSGSVWCGGRALVACSGDRYCLCHLWPNPADDWRFATLKAAGVPVIVAALGANGDLSRAAVDRALRASPSARVQLLWFGIEPQGA